MMRISERKLSLVIFIAAAIVLLTFWTSLWAVIQQRGFKHNFKLKNPSHFAVEFLLFNFVIAAVFLSSLKPLSSDEKAEDEVDMLSHVAETGEKMNDDDDDDDGCYGHDECDGGSEYCEGDNGYVYDDDIDPVELEKRADEFIAKMTQRWIEERMKEKLNYALKMI